MQTVSLKCKNCGYQLKFNPEQKKYICEACDSEFLIETSLPKKEDFIVVAKKLEKYTGYSELVDLPGDVLIIGQGVFKGIETIESIGIPEGVYKIESEAFANCSRLKYVTFPQTLETIGSAAFLNSGLIEVEIPDSIKTIEKEAFKDCLQLKKVVLPDKDIAFEKTFKGCSSLAEVIFNMDRFCPSFYSSTEANKKEDRRPTFFDAFQSTPFYNTLYSTYLKNECVRCHGHIDIKKVCQSCGLKYVGKPSGCYIATAVYGSYDCPEVWTLRRYRDEKLAESRIGRAFIKAYYSISPKLVRIFGDNDFIKRIVKKHLDCKVRKLNAKGVENTEYVDNVY